MLTPSCHEDFRNFEQRDARFFWPASSTCWGATSPRQRGKALNLWT